MPLLTKNGKLKTSVAQHRGPLGQEGAAEIRPSRPATAGSGLCHRIVQPKRTEPDAARSVSKLNSGHMLREAN